MSDDFNKNDYEDYFKTLDNRLKEKYSAKRINSSDDSQKKHVKKRSKKNIYAVIRIKPIMVIIIIVALILSTVGIVKLTKSDKHNSFKSNSTIKTQSSESSVPYENPDYDFDLGQNVSGIPGTNDAEGAVVVDLKSKEIIAARNANNKFYPASTTKIMTLLTAVDYIDNYNDTFTMTKAITDPLYVQDATVAGFLDGEIINMTDLLYGIILPSGADACMAIAIKISGSEEKFVKLMNKKSKELGLKNTNFVNTTGLFNESHYTTPHDMAVILNAAIKSPICKKILSTYQYTTAKTEQHPDGILLTSTLFGSMYGTEPETATISGGKTGFVNESRYCIASFGYNNTTQNEYIIVTFKNSSKWPAIHGQIELYKEFAK